MIHEATQRLTKKGFLRVASCAFVDYLNLGFA